MAAVLNSLLNTKLSIFPGVFIIVIISIAIFVLLLNINKIKTTCDTILFSKTTTYILIFLGITFGTLLAGVSLKWLMATIDNFKSTSANPDAVANNFMLFISLLFIVLSLIVGLVNYYFSRWYAKDKEAALREYLPEIADKFIDKNGDKLIQSIFEQEQFTESLNNIISEKYSSAIEEIRIEYDKYLEDIDKKHQKTILNLKTELMNYIAERLGNVQATKKESTSSDPEIEEILKELRKSEDDSEDI